MERRPGGGVFIFFISKAIKKIAHLIALII
jgi:hypothetical protein